jgi:hypothetical protein
MKLFLVFCLVMFLTSASTYSSEQEKEAPFCTGRPVSITTLPEPKMTFAPIPLRSGGTREFPKIHFLSDGPLQFVIRDRIQFTDFWKRAQIFAIPGVGFPPMPEIDFSKKMLVAVVMGNKPTPGYQIIIDGACEIDGRLDVFMTSIDPTGCSQFEGKSAAADIVILPRTDLPVVFRENKVDCKEWRDQVIRLNRPNAEK